MGPELVYEDMIMRLDGDVLEVFTAGANASRRTPLRWLAVRAEPLKKNRVQLTVGAKNFNQVTQDVDLPLYAWAKLDGIYQQQIFTIEADEEPAFRAFFEEAARACGRSVGQMGES
jgi:hypothetical protein